MSVMSSGARGRLPLPRQWRAKKGVKSTFDGFSLF